MKGPGQPINAKNDVNKYAVDVLEKRIFLKVSLKLLMQLMSRHSTAFFATGNKLLAENSTVSIDNNKSKRR